jgi:hypothetical protein
VVLLTQFVAPALLLVPGISAVRLVLRVATFAVALMAWAGAIASGRRVPGRRGASAGWAKFSAVWLGLAALNPSAASPLAAVAGLVLNLAILSPAFWVPATVRSAARLERLLAILFLCNAASAVVGILQYYYPGRFDPPEMRLTGKYGRDQYTYKTDDGREVMRPCGLSDSPGGAAPAGLYTCVVGIAFALRPIAAWKRMGCLGLAFIGMATIYTTHVRTALVLVLAGQVAMAWMLAMRRDFAKLTQLGVTGGLIFVAALGWAMRNGGSALVERFATLLEGSSGQVYYKNRGGFLDETMNVLIWQYPLGAGMGRWGMVYMYFGGVGESLWAEIQPTAWVYDGGIPLLVGYSGAVGLAVLEAVRAATRARDRSLAYTAMIIAVVGATILVNCLSYIPFIGSIGMQFWVLLGALAGVAARQPARGRPPGRPAAPRPARAR